MITQPPRRPGNSSSRSRRLAEAAGSAARLMESLEPRQLLAVVAWDGGPTGNGTNLVDPVNWAGDVLPASTDDVTIDATGSNPVITLAAAKTFNSVTSSRAMQINAGGTLSSPGVSAMSASLTLNGGTLAGGTWQFSGGASVVISNNNSNALTNVTLQGGSVTLGDTAYLNLNGTITLDGVGVTLALSGNQAYLGIQSNTTLAGTGAVVFSGTNGSRRGIEGRGANRVLTIDPGITLRGGYADLGGSRFSGQTLTLVNNGTISADVSGQTINLLSALGTFTNTGTLEGRDGGVISLQTTIIQGAGGTFESVTGGQVRLDGGTITTSTLDAGDIAALTITNNSANTFTNVTLQGGSVTLGDTAYLNLNGTITLDGAGVTFALSGNTAYLGIQSNTTLSGTGAVVFSGTTGGRRGIEGRGAGRTLTVGPQVTIRGGYADLGGSRASGQALTLVNNGTISADVGGQTINLLSALGTFTNTGTLEGNNGGVVSLQTTIIQGAGGTFETTTGGAVRLDGGTITTSTLDAGDIAALTITNNFANAFTNVTLQGGSVTLGDSAYLNLNGTITLDGSGVTLALSGDRAYLGIQSNTTLAGTGAVVFSGTTGLRRGIESRGAGRTLTVGPQVTIRGGYADLGGSRLSGQALTLVNNGSLSADVSGQTINLLSALGTFTNTGTLEGNNGGVVSLQTTIIQGAGGTFETTTGGAVRLDGGTITTSTLDAGDIAALTITNNFANAFTNVTLQGGSVTLGDSAYLNLNGTITLDGSGVTLALSGDRAYLGIQSNTTLAGTGAVVFSGTTGLRRGIESRSAGRTLTVNPQVTIRGGFADLGGSRLSGSALTLVNNGTISADVSGQSVNITSIVTMTNAGTAEAVGGGTLRLDGALGNTGLIAGVTGTVRIGGTLSNSTQTLDAATGTWILDGGTISSSTLIINAGGGLSISNTNSNTFTNVTLQGGSVTLGDLAYLNLNGLITLDGVGVTLTLSGSQSYLGIQGNTALSGTGAVVFSGTTGLRRGIESRSAGRTLTVNPQVTIRGGFADLGGSRLSGSALTLVNNGTISADVGGQTLVVTPSVTLTNLSAGTLTGGSWKAIGGTLTTTGAVTTLGAGTTVELGAGGVWTSANSITTNSGTFRLSGGRDFSGASFTNSGTLDLSPGSVLSTTGAFTQTGAGKILSTLAGTDPATQFGRVSATGLATLDGTLQIALASGYTPTIVSTFDVVTAGSRTGAFATITPPVGLPARTAFYAVYSPTSARLEFDHALGVWTGLAGDNLWATPGNWARLTLPDAGIDAYISLASNPTVQVTGAQTARSVVTDEVLSIVGTLTTIQPSIAAADITLAAGTINGGTFNLSGGAAIRGTGAGGTLSDVTVNGDVVLGAGANLTVLGTTSFTTARLTGSLANLRLAAGYTLNSAVVADGSADGDRVVTISPDTNGTVTIGPAGSIRLLDGFDGGLTLGDNGFTTTLVNNGLISGENTDWILQVSNSINTFINNGTVQAVAGSVRLESVLTNAGTMRGVTGNLDIAGTFNATGTTQTLDATTGSWNVRAGTINGGTFNLSGGATIRGTGAGGTLSDVTVNGDVAIPGGASLTLAGSTRFSAARLQGGGSTLNLAPGYVINDLVVAEGAAAGTRFIRSAFGGSGTNTIGSTGVVRLAAGTGGDLALDQGASATLINDGLIESLSASHLLSIATSAFTNNAEVQALGGAVAITSAVLTNLVAGTLTGGTWRALDGAIESAGAINTLGADATVELGDGGTWLAAESVTTNSGVLILSGGRDFSTTSFLNLGRLTLSAGSTLSTGTFSQGDKGTLVVEASGPVPSSQFGRIVATGSASLGGAFELHLVEGYQPALFTRFDVVQGAVVNGEFAALTTPTSPSTRKWSSSYDTLGFSLLFTSVADWDGNGVINSTDVSNFINDWFQDQASGTLTTDFNGDGVSNSTDVSDFINQWFVDLNG